MRVITNELNKVSLTKVGAAITGGALLGMQFLPASWAIYLGSLAIIGGVISVIGGRDVLGVIASNLNDIKKKG
jgi:hypothetical protein